jgi:hypothetical protein
MSDIEEALKRITAHQGVMGVAVFDDTGKLARYSLIHGIQTDCYPHIVSLIPGAPSLTPVICM